MSSVSLSSFGYILTFNVSHQHPMIKTLTKYSCRFSSERHCCVRDCKCIKIAQLQKHTWLLHYNQPLFCFLLLVIRCISLCIDKYYNCFFYFPASHWIKTRQLVSKKYIWFSNVNSLHNILLLFRDSALASNEI